MKFLLGEKIGMSQVFDAAGAVVPVTVVRVMPHTVIGIKTKARDGYDAVQWGIGTQNPPRIKKPQRGFFGEGKNFRWVRESRIFQNAPVSALPQPGARVDAGLFKEGDRVKVSGISKAKGFQGVVKRHGFRGAPATHGTKHAHREPGAIGGSGGRAGGRVAKGMRMAGRMGGERVTVRNLTVIKSDPEKHLLLLKGAVPGRRGTLLEINAL